MKKIIAVLAILTLTIGVFYSCSKKDEKNEIKVGVILPLTAEGLGDPSERVLNGINLAISEDDTTLLRIKLIVEDSHAKSEQSISAFQKIISLQDCKIVIGDFLSSGTNALLPIVNSRKIFLISPTASSPDLSKPNDYFFRVWASDYYDAKVAVDYIESELKLKKATVVYWNDPYAEGLKNIFVNEAKLKGISTIEDYSYESNISDFKTIISKIKKTDAEVIYLPGIPITNANFIKQAKELNLNKTIISNVAAQENGFLEIAGNSASGIYFSAPSFNLDDTSKSLISFKEKYYNQFKTEPDIHSIKGYECMKIIIEAIHQNKVTPEDIASFINNKRFFNFAGDKIEFDDNGDVKTNYTVYKYNSELKAVPVKIINFLQQ
jgi:branched-chain amino acid transport system substrate-binding protein